MWTQVEATGWRGRYFLPMTTGVSKVASHMIALAAARANHKTTISIMYELWFTLCSGLGVLSSAQVRISLTFNLKNVNVNHRYSVFCVLVWYLMFWCQLQWRCWRMKSVGGLYALVAGKHFQGILVRPAWTAWPLTLRHYSIRNSS